MERRKTAATLDAYLKHPDMIAEVCKQFDCKDAEFVGELLNESLMMRLLTEGHDTDLISLLTAGTSGCDQVTPSPLRDIDQIMLIFSLLLIVTVAETGVTLLVFMERGYEAMEIDRFKDERINLYVLFGLKNHC